MTKQHHTTSIKDLGWSINLAIQNFLKKDRAEVASRMKNDGLRTSQIARYMFGEANKQTISKVAKLLKEVK